MTISKNSIKYIIFMLVIIILFLTNPTKPEFTEWTTNKLMEQAQTDMVKGLTSLFGNALIDSVTVRHNYILFSVFDVNYDKQDMKVLGISKIFIPLTNMKITNNDSKKNFNSF